MVSASDLRAYKTTNNLGGAITATQINSASPNNVFVNVPKNELVTGEDYYACIYWKNAHATESMDNFKIWLSNKSFPPDTALKWAFDPSFTTSIFFDGSNDYIDAGTQVTLWDQALTKFSFSVWIYPTAGWDGFARSVVKHGAPLAQSFHCGIDPTTPNEIFFQIKNAGGSTIAATNNTLQLNTWNFITCVYDNSLGSANLKTYVNAVVGGTTASLTETINLVDGLGLADAANDFKGFMKDFRWWTTKALNQTEIDSIYAGIGDGIIPDYWLPMTEGTGNPVDSIGSKTTTLSGAVWNLVAQTIADKYTSPAGVTWHSLGSSPSTPYFQTLVAGQTFPMWLWLHVDANAQARLDDSGLFNFSFDIPQGGTGTGGGGAGGGGADEDPNPSVLNLDQFGLNMLFPTKVGALEWFNKWDTGSSRNITNAFDTGFDSEFGVTSAPGATIVGDGTAKIETLGNVRLFVHGPWTNTEQTVQIKIDTALTSFELRGRSNHHGVNDLPYGMESSSPQISCGFGGYDTNFVLNEDATRQSVEVIHDCYQRNLDQGTSIGQNPGDGWVGYKQVIRSVGTAGVRVEGWINRNVADQTDWVKTHDFTYDGANTNPDATEPNVTTCLALGDSISGDLVANSKWLNASYWTWIRTFSAENVNFRYWSVREINPIPEPGGGSGGGTGGNPPPPNTDYKIAVAGDWGCESATDSVLSLINSQGYDFVMGVGDNAYSSASCWTSRFKSLKDAGKFDSAYGNHEYEESGGIAPYKTFFGHNLTYFTHKFQNVLFIVIDSNINMDAGSAQHTFVENALTQAASDNTITWKVAVLHHPMFGASSQHSYDSGGSVEAFMALFQQNKVSFVCAGHNHNFQRSFQVSYNAGSPTNPTVVDNTSPYSRNAVGLIHVVSGGGGHDSGSSLYSLGSQPSFQAFQNRTHNGVWEMVASNNGQTLTCQFRDTNGDVYDTFVITA